MSGVKVGTRLERLYLLRDQIRHEIAAEERALVLNGGRGSMPRRLRARAGTVAADARKAASLDELGVTAKQVKQWAVEVGLIPAVVRGRVAQALVDEYAHAHRSEVAG